MSKAFVSTLLPARTLHRSSTHPFSTGRSHQNLKAQCRKWFEIKPNASLWNRSTHRCRRRQKKYYTIGHFLSRICIREYWIQKLIVLFHQRNKYRNDSKGSLGRHFWTSSWTVEIVILDHRCIPTTSSNLSTQVRQHAKFVHKKLNERVKHTDHTNRMTGNIWRLTESSSSHAKLSDNDKCRKHVRHLHAKKKVALNESQKNQKDQKKKHLINFFSFESSMSASRLRNFRRNSLLA